MPEPEKITIIEGPPPTFELVSDTWLFGLSGFAEQEFIDLSSG